MLKAIENESESVFESADALAIIAADISLLFRCFAAVIAAVFLRISINFRDLGCCIGENSEIPALQTPGGEAPSRRFADGFGCRVRLISTA